MLALPYKSLHVKTAPGQSGAQLGEPHALPITDTRAVRAWHHAWAEGRINLSALLPTSGSFHVNLLASQSCQELFLIVHLGEDSQWLLELPFLPPSSLHPLKKAFIYRASQACALYCPLELVSLHWLYMEPWQTAAFSYSQSLNTDFECSCRHCLSYHASQHYLPRSSPINLTGLLTSGQETLRSAVCITWCCISEFFQEAQDIYVSVVHI